MIRIDFQLAKERINEIIKELEIKVSDKSSFFKLVGIYLTRITAEVFKKQGRRAGRPKWKWFSLLTLHPSWKAITSKFPLFRGYRYNPSKWNIRRKTGATGGVRYQKGDKLLQSTGQLRASFKKLSTGKNFIQFGSKLAYASAHQFGSGNLPARPILFLSKGDKEAIKKKWKWFKTNI